MTDISRIAIIEDNKVIRDNVVKYIKLHEEFEVVGVFTSVEELPQKKEVDPTWIADILLLDIGLPGMSGIEGIPQIRALLPELDIMMLTTYEEEDIIVKALCSGACSYLSKKSSLKEIVDAIRIVIKGGSYMSPSIAREIVQYMMGGQIKKTKVSTLSDRQLEILELLVDGRSYQAISEELFISVETVRSHVKRIYRALEVSNKTEAKMLYMKGKIV